MTVSPFAPVAVRCADLSLARGGRRLAAGVGFAAEPGAAVLVRGRNGAGKSTLLRVLAGFLKPAGGAAAFTDVDGADWPAREVCALLSHADGLGGEETPAEHVRFYARWLGDGRTSAAADAIVGAGVEAALAAFRLQPIAARPARSLSAGQKRRAALARVLASGRPVWLLDEPAAPLDAQARADLDATVARHRAAGGVVIAAVHDAPSWPGAQTLVIGAAP